MDNEGSMTIEAILEYFKTANIIVPYSLCFN